MLHLVSLPHTSTTPAYSWCAYTSKVAKFARMMTPRGHPITLYGGPENDAPVHEHVVCNWELPENGQIPAFDASDPMFARFNARAIEAIGRRISERDLILLIGGTAQQPIADAFASHQVVEFGIGYGGVIPSTHWIFESHAWMHAVYGASTGGDPHRADGRLFDCVIPNYFDAAEFPAGDGDGGYLLYVGRLTERKGVQIALDVAHATGLALKVAGAGEFPLPERVEYCGVVGPHERAELMGGATALLCPTLYLEPFGGVAVEAQMCGTPAISTDFGAFPETVEHGVSGFRCHTLQEFVDAVEEAPYLDRGGIRARALGRYSLEAVAPLYEQQFARLSSLWGDGFYALRDPEPQAA